jgi:hypothetical protein
MTLRSQVAPGTSKRDDFPLVKSKAALIIIIDIQKYLSTPQTNDASDGYLFCQALPSAIEKTDELSKVFRQV